MSNFQVERLREKAVLKTAEAEAWKALAERLREALRSFCIGYAYEHADDDLDNWIRGNCYFCDTSWNKGEPENHRHDCMARLP